MNFWRYDELASRLKAGKVSEKEKFYYFFIFMLCWYLSSVPHISQSFNNVDKINIWLSLISLILLTFGLSCLYKTNKKGDDKNFIERVVCLSFPIGIRLVAFSIPVFSIAFIIGTYGANMAVYMKLGVGYGIAFMLYYYYALYHGIKIAAGKQHTGKGRK